MNGHQARALRQIAQQQPPAYREVVYASLKAWWLVTPHHLKAGLLTLMRRRYRA